MAALQFLAIAGYYASLRLALHHHKRTLHPVQLIFLGLTLQVDPGVGADSNSRLSPNSREKI
jgi:hypothetical protein